MAHKKKILIDPASLSMPFGGVDSHAHLDSQRLWEDIDEILERAKNCGVSHIGQVFLRHEKYIDKKDYFVDKDNIFFIYGIHPTDLLDIFEDELDNIKQDIILDKKNAKKIKAIGEIGLDYYWKEVPADLQKEYFRRQLIMTKELDLPVVIHSREAFEDTYQILMEEGFKTRPLLWHCFDKDTEKAEKIIENNWYISIPGQITYKGNDAMREALHVIPKDKLLLETDCPYLSAEPWRGKRNEPALCVFTASFIAQELGREKEELWLQCGDNARTFFSLESAD